MEQAHVLVESVSTVVSEEPWRDTCHVGFLALRIDAVEAIDILGIAIGSCNEFAESAVGCVDSVGGEIRELQASRAEKRLDFRRRKLGRPAGVPLDTNFISKMRINDCPQND